MSITIAVDAMGADRAPKPEVEGAILAARQCQVRVLLVGQEQAVAGELARHPEAASLPIEVVHASEFIGMDEKDVARAVKGKRDSSMRVGLRLVKDGIASGFVSAGNTGAAMVTAKMVLGVLPGVDRPALATVFPTAANTATIMLDVGANVDCKPQNLQQFAIMGEVYFRTIFAGRFPTSSHPRVGLLSVGEEETKGNDLTHDAFQLIKELPLNFLGNVEGRDLYNGRADVIVCDGFVGNVALKVSEGLVEAIRSMLKESMAATLTRQMGYLMAKGAFQDFKKRLDYSEYGGAPLLGLKGVAIVSHGSSNGNAIKNAIRVAAEFARSGLNQKIEEQIQATHDHSRSAVE
jgi:glycerol-3-phosphate acyltransferase PlsX